jgi:Reverse transcriptase (RNA-dependent DNA polymerase)
LAFTRAAELIDIRNSINSGYNLRSQTAERQVFSALTKKAARTLYGDNLVDAASVEELKNCIQKEVWAYLDPEYTPRSPIPSKMFLTPKKLPNGKIDKMKGRVVAGGHRQDRSLYQDSDISSPTVALTSVAARDSHCVMTLDHKAAYLNATMSGPPVEMMLSAEVAEILCRLGPTNNKFLRRDRRIAVRLKKALYGCIQSAVLWHKELASTLTAIGFAANPHDICSFQRVRDNTTDRVLVYVDDLLRKIRQRWTPLLIP